MKLARYTLFVCIIALVAGCQIIPHTIDPQRITSINIMDRNGLSQTISAKERLTEFEKTDFLTPQPYQKVMRVYGKQKNGNVNAQITSYHPNGEVKQLLESVNNRAYGRYCEWFPNGQLKIQAYVIGGIADLNTQAEDSWLFEGVNSAWDEDGNLLAELPYYKGELYGTSLFYHPSGILWKQTPYVKNQIHGTQETYLKDGTLLLTTEYTNGVKDGTSIRYWDGHYLAYQEQSVHGKLMEASYYSRDGELISEIKGGYGFRAIFGEDHVQELQEFKQGNQEGLVKIFDSQSNLVRSYEINQGEKHGIETDFFPGTNKPKLQLTWHRGVLEGVVKTWFESGNLESQREMCRNTKNGLLTAWYRSGALMMVEEYECDTLLKGEYYRLGEKIPVSKIDKGKGVATLFNPEGNFSKKVHYQNGRPIN